VAFDRSRSRGFSDDGEERREEFFPRVTEVAIVLFLLDLKLALASFDVHCQLECFQVGLAALVSVESAIERLLQLACEVGPDVIRQHLGGTWLAWPSLAPSGACELALEDELVGPYLRVLAVDRLAVGARVSGLRAQLRQLVERDDLLSVEP